MFTKWFRILSLPILILAPVGLLLLACTNLGFDSVGPRTHENFEGGLTVPGDIDPAGTNQFSFVMMGDTHIGSPGGEVMKRIVADAVDHHDAFAVIAGDVSQGAQDGEFDQFISVFASANLSWRAAIGNHDLYFGGWERYKKKIGRSIYSFNADNVHFAMLDSANGILGQDQLQWLESDLAGDSHEHKILVTHFAPWNGQFSSIYKMSSEEEAAILKDIAYRHGVKLVVSGHYHGHSETTIGGVRYIVSGGANDILDLGERQNYLRVHVDGSTLTVDTVYY
jgi:3',5'-cyclic AMP phosphodiesterase CpdA